MSARRLCDLPRVERRLELERFTPGTIVSVTYSGMRERASASHLVGTVVGVASPITGGQSDELVLKARRAGYPVELVTLSAATIIDVEVLAEHAEPKVEAASS